MRFSPGLVANIGFIFLFPGFFFWHLGMASSVIPYQIGFFREVSLIILASYFLIFFPALPRIAVSSNFSLMTTLFLSYCTLWVAFGSLNMPPPGSVEQAFSIIILWVALLLVGFFIEIEEPLFIKSILLCLFLMAFFVFYYLEGSQFIVRSFSKIDEGIASYQGFSRSVTVTTMVILSLIRSSWKRHVCSVLSILLVFFMSARAELVSMIFAVLLLELIVSVKNRINAVTVLILGIAVYFLVVSNSDFLSQSRQFRLLNLDDDSSWNARQEMSRFAWRQISDNPIFGVFGGHYFFDGDIGSFAHNALSAWVSFGILGFMIYLTLAIWAAAGSFVLLRRFPELSPCRLSFYLNVSSLVIILFAQPVFWPLSMFGWGIFLRLNKRMKFHSN